MKEQQEIAKRLAKDTSTVTRWLQKYRVGGLSELLAIKKAPGEKPKIDDAALLALEGLKILFLYFNHLILLNSIPSKGCGNFSKNP
ncbi:helix-turn-helix domain-containing protein [Nostoc sp. CCY0012]|uniref:helix-turn-helix domain-containing protein n=1 Tax=Nostoc sp. CCY0012 TaxID=1056123 RepID=UPI0039C6B3AC